MIRKHPLVLASLAAMFIVPTFASAEVKPGDVITRLNMDKVTELVSPGVLFAVDNGMDLNIIPYKSIPGIKIYDEATEKYSEQVTLGDDQNLNNWVSGRPFPNIKEDDPTVATKIMWNFQRTHYYTDDLSVHLPDADTGAFFQDHTGERVYQIERHFIADWSRRLRFQGRLQNEPIPNIEDNPHEVFEKQGFFPLIEPFDLKGVGVVTYRYLDPEHHDDTWLYTPVIRRVRRLSSSQRSDALFGQDIDLDSFGGYAGQVPWFDWKLLGTKPMLVSFHGENLPPVVCKGDGGVTYCENWEVRPKVYVIEGTAKLPGYAYSKRLIYVDAETYIIPYSDLYDNNDELWKTVIQNIRTSKQPNPKIDFSYPEERMFVYAFTVLDMQLRHGTRAAIPGMQFPNEPGWYIDIGFDHKMSAQEDWYQVSSLIASGR